MWLEVCMDFFQQIWSQALVTVTGAEEEAQRLLQRAQGMVGWSQEEARRLAERLASQRREMERRVEEAVKTSVARLKVPRRDEIAQLAARLEAVARRIEALSK
jgi:polyhydroxyalkanoate synthesis regulator phasin